MTISALFMTISLQFGLPQGLLSSLCYVESKHNIDAIHLNDGIGHSIGICQIKLATAKWLGFKGPEAELMLPKNNIFYAAKYLAYQNKRYKDMNRAIIAYNKGHSTNIESNNYLHKVLNQWGRVDVARY